MGRAGLRLRGMGDTDTMSDKKENIDPELVRRLRGRGARVVKSRHAKNDLLIREDYLRGTSFMTPPGEFDVSGPGWFSWTDIVPDAEEG